MLIHRYILGDIIWLSCNAKWCGDHTYDVVKCNVVSVRKDDTHLVYRYMIYIKICCNGIINCVVFAKWSSYHIACNYLVNRFCGNQNHI